MCLQLGLVYQKKRCPLIAWRRDAHRALWCARFAPNPHASSIVDSEATRMQRKDVNESEGESLAIVGDEALNIAAICQHASCQRSALH